MARQTRKGDKGNKANVKFDTYSPKPSSTKIKLDPTKSTAK